MTFALRPYQQAAVAAVYEHLRTREDNPAVVLPTGCHAEGHPILMYDGTIKPVEEIRVGDEVMGPDSQRRRVLALCRGEDELFRISPRRGEAFVVNAQHVLSLVCTREGKPYPSSCQGGEIEHVTVAEYLRKPRSWKHLRKLYRAAIDFPGPHDLPIPPYVLGLLLGDGCLRKGCSLTTADGPLADSWERYADQIGCDVTVFSEGRSCPTYGLRRRQGKYNVLTEALEQLELAGQDSAGKFIPHPYLTATRQDRLSLLAGLMDTDGSLNRCGFEITTKSQELAADIVFLARSLGFGASCRQKYSYCQTGAGGWFFRIHIYGDLEQVPCRLARKQAPRRRQKKSVLRTGFSVEPCGGGPFFGFVLDGDHRYVDGHFVVHHNSGKSWVIAQLVKDAVLRWDGRVLVLAHVKELLEQNAHKIQQLCADLSIGIYSAGLNRRETDKPAIVAGIQSVYKRACELDAFDLAIVDEAHLIPPDGEGMYRTFLAEARVVNPHLRVIGLTATPFRLASGPICTREGILNHICYEVGVRELIRDGYLCPLVTKAGINKADFERLHVRGGEFVADEVEDLMDDDRLVASACGEIVAHTHDRRSVLVFAAGVRHGRHVARVLAEMSGREVGFLDGQTPTGERAELIARFRGESRDLLGQRVPLKYLVNVNVLTTGFDAPNVDCVAILRPTMSPGLWYQCVGRGFRLHPGKQNCLVLDFGGNALRHGPVDQLKTPGQTANGTGEAPAKECPECHAVIAAAYARCPECGYEFPPPERQKHDARASTAGVLSGKVTDTEYEVLDIRYSVHTKRDAPPDAPKTMRVDYFIGKFTSVSEWVCFEHDGYARWKAEQWWRRRSPDPVPDTAERAVEIAEAGGVARTEKIVVRSVAGEKYDRIVGYTLAPKPEPVPIGDAKYALDDVPF